MTKKQIPIAIFLWSAITCFASSSIAGQTWNSATDFSLKYSEGVWNYLYGTELNPNVFDYYDTSLISNGVEVWVSSKYSIGTYPNITLIPSTPPRMGMMPGYSGLVSALGFIFPSAGTYSIQVNFSTEQGDADKYVLLDSETLWFGPSGEQQYPNFSYTQTFGSDFDHHVIYFIVSGDPDAILNYVGIDATITRLSTSAEPIPEPSTCALLAVGLIAFAGFAKRRQTG